MIVFSGDLQDVRSELPARGGFAGDSDVQDVVSKQ